MRDRLEIDRMRARPDDAVTLAGFRVALFGTCETCYMPRDARLTVLGDGSRRQELYCPACEDAGVEDG